MGDKFTVEKSSPDFIFGGFEAVIQVLTGLGDTANEVKVTNQQTGETRICPDADTAARYIKNNS